MSKKSKDSLVKAYENMSFKERVSATRDLMKVLSGRKSIGGDTEKLC